MTLWQTLFGFAGRIGRGTFWLLIIAVLLLDLAVVALVSDWIRSQYLEAGVPHRPGGDVIGAGFGLLIVGVISAWAAVGVMVKRAHDLERNAWWLLIGLIPVYGLARLIMDLGFQAGSSRRNRFGEGANFVGNRKAAHIDRPVVLALETAEVAQASVFERPSDDPSEQQGPPDGAQPVGVAEPEVFQPQTTPVEFESVPERDPVHPLMLWGKTYKADLNWPEFQAFAPSGSDGNAPFPAQALMGHEASVIDPPRLATGEAQWLRPEAPDQAEASVGETARAGQAPAAPEPEPEALAHAEGEGVYAQRVEPELSVALAWTPAPVRQAYVEIDGSAPQPANDPHIPREPV